MFNKQKFSEIFKKIYNSYDNQRDFASSTGVNRAYISQYMNCKLSNPPTPKILKKIADGSKGLTTYNELMEVCGYFKGSPSNNTAHIAQRIFDENLYLLEKYHLLDKDLMELEKILVERNENDYDVESQLDNFASYTTCENFDDGLSIKDFATDIFKINSDITDILNNYQKADYEYPIPLFNNILIDKVGLFDRFNSHIIKYINLNIDLEKISDLRKYFGLVISDNSMAPLLDIGDIAIIKGTYQYKSYDNGGTYLLQVNDSPVIIRKIVDTPNGIELHALNMWNYPVQTVSVLDINIIGKVIRAENNSAFK